MAELVVAMVIITGVLLVLMAIQTSSLVTIAEAGRRQQATAYVNGTLEQMRAIPWTVLSRGLSGNFLTAAGGDPNVSAGVLKVGGVSETLVVAPTTGAGSQPLTPSTSVWTPLFDSTGSNKVVNQSPSVPGIEFETRAYVTVVPGAPEALGLTVIGKWTDLSSGQTSQTVLRTVAYAPSGGCGDLDLQPFLSSCQARFTGGASSGSIVITAAASLEPPDEATHKSLVPNSGFRSFVLATAQARATVTSQQVTEVESALVYGGEEANREDGSSWSAAMPRGFDTFAATASDDTATPGAPGPTASATRLQASPGRFAIASGTQPKFEFAFASDQYISGSADASIVNACALGVPAGEPCAQAVLGGGLTVIAQYAYKDVSNFTMTPFVREGTSDTRSNAWAGRFVTNAGTSECTSLKDEGCVAAAAAKSSETIRISVPGGSTNWEFGGFGGAADGIVYIKDYEDSVSVERGPDQKAAIAAVKREGTLYYWNGATYIAQDLDESVNTFIGDPTLPELTWTANGGKVTAVASTTIQIVGNISPTVIGTDPNCLEDLCGVTATAGSIIVTTSYLITVDGLYDRVATFTVTINGSQASAAYRGARDRA